MSQAACTLVRESFLARLGREGILGPAMPCEPRPLPCLLVLLLYSGTSAKCLRGGYCPSSVTAASRFKSSLRLPCGYRVATGPDLISMAAFGSGCRVARLQVSLLPQEGDRIDRAFGVGSATQKALSIGRRSTDGLNHPAYETTTKPRSDASSSIRCSKTSDGTLTTGPDAPRPTRT